jgi:hypothetical protein
MWLSAVLRLKDSNWGPAPLSKLVALIATLSLVAFDQEALDIGMREEQAPADARWAQLTSAYEGADRVRA